jgi:hypothetical protein
MNEVFSWIIKHISLICGAFLTFLSWLTKNPLALCICCFVWGAYVFYVLTRNARSDVVASYSQIQTAVNTGQMQNAQFAIQNPAEASKNFNSTNPIGNQ